MTSVVTAPEPPLGSKDNPHPFKRGEKRIINGYYFNSKGQIRKWTIKGFRISDTSDTILKKWASSKKWTYDKFIKLLENTPLKTKITKKEFNKTYKNMDTKLPIIFKCGCKKDITGRTLRKHILLSKNEKSKCNYLCEGNYCKVIVNSDQHQKNKTQKQMKKEKERREKTIEGRLKYELKGCSSRTNNRNKRGRNHDKVDIDLEYVLELWENCNGICPRFKIKMSLLDGDKWKVSIDRIDSSKGYIKGNVQLVCVLYNLMKNKLPEEEMDEAFDQLKLAYSNTSL
tara:strand:- start:776 stop:1630 length:855 start_codon:yes stop_codon:yes gene_type:complete